MDRIREYKNVFSIYLRILMAENVSTESSAAGGLWRKMHLQVEPSEWSTPPELLVPDPKEKIFRLKRSDRCGC